MTWSCSALYFWQYCDANSLFPIPGIPTIATADFEFPRNVLWICENSSSLPTKFVDGSVGTPYLNEGLKCLISCKGQPSLQSGPSTSLYKSLYSLRVFLI